MSGVLRQPTYTGANRCLPCTVLNVALVLVAAALLLQVSPEAAIVVVFGGFTATYLRGYVIPGTPRLTKRYLPDRLLDWFGNHPAGVAVESDDGREETDDSSAGDPFDLGLDGVTVEETLIEAGALVKRWDGTDLRLSDGFQRDWDRALRNLPPDPVVDLTPLVGTEHADTATVDANPPAVTLTIEDTQVGWWPSSAAFRTDVAGGRVLSRLVTEWHSYNFAERASILAGLRLWLQRCPNCDGKVVLGAEPVESCCSTREVIALRCGDCDIRLVEVPQP